ncbi:unnamed protein product, partial [marine sediment metagenome]
MTNEELWQAALGEIELSISRQTILLGLKTRISLQGKVTRLLLVYL